MEGRVVLHSDLNNCYASIECMLHPELRGKYIAVCGSTEDRHGIVLAKNQLAKQCGVKTGEVIWEAKQKCPQLTIVEPHMEQYLKFSKIVRSIMSKFQNYLKTFDITSTLTEEDIDKTLALLQIYGPAVRRTASRIGEMEEECYEGRRQSISDFINLAIDYDRDTDRKRIADRLAEMGHSMQLLSVMENALVLVKDTPPNGGTYFNILQARYFDVYCTSNEEAYLNLGISSSTYYRHIKPAIRAYAASLWCVVIPDLIIREHLQQSGSITAQVEVS